MKKMKKASLLAAALLLCGFAILVYVFEPPYEPVQADEDVTPR